MSMGPNPYAPGTPGMGGAVPPDIAKKAGNMQLMGILSIVIGLCCCPIIGIILSVIVLTQAGGVTTSLQQYGAPSDLMSKVNTGKICAIVGIVVSILNAIVGVALQVGGALNQ